MSSNVQIDVRGHIHGRHDHIGHDLRDLQRCNQNGHSFVIQTPAGPPRSERRHAFVVVDPLVLNAAAGRAYTSAASWSAAPPSSTSASATPSGSRHPREAEDAFRGTCHQRGCVALGASRHFWPFPALVHALDPERVPPIAMFFGLNRLAAVQVTCSRPRRLGARRRPSRIEHQSQ